MVGLHHSDRRLTANRGDLTLEIADAGLARVVPDDVENRLVGELDVLRFEAVHLALFLEQILLGDLELLGFGVTGDTDDLQAVLQGPRNPL